MGAKTHPVADDAKAVDELVAKQIARFVLWHARHHDRMRWFNPRLEVYSVIDRARAFAR